jgi:hypothetical protein
VAQDEVRNIVYPEHDIAGVCSIATSGLESNGRKTEGGRHYRKRISRHRRIEKPSNRDALKHERPADEQ